MKILFYFSHPAQYFFLRETIKRLIKTNHVIIILIKTKDVLEDVLIGDNFEYINILPTERGLTKLDIFFSLLKRLRIMFPILIEKKPDLLIGADASIAILGKFLHINRITITEDDYAIIRILAEITYPFTQTILCPVVCSVGKYEQKKIGYHGYMKLGYLHPNIFTPEFTVKQKYQLGDNYILIRLSGLKAHHDFGIKGISESVLKRLIFNAEKFNYKVFISSEKKIKHELQQYELKINPRDMHSVLANASILICDSQSMSVEAAILGVPSIRISDFVGRISVLEELEHKYGLTYGVKPGNEDFLFERFNYLLNNKYLKDNFQYRKNNMLRDKIDVTAFLVWFVENYPESVKIMKETPEYQYRFR